MAESHEEYRVWAPIPERVEVEIDGARSAMERRDDGWWHLAGVTPVPGARYGFALDGGDCLPDPRSQWQPDGVHGLSRAVDERSFTWTDEGFRAAPLGDAVIYEAHVGTFSGNGTFADVVERFDHLVDLGVTHLELMPIAGFAGRHGWGYDGVTLYAPHRAYGSPDDLRGLVDAAHACGLAVLLDVVYNHLGPEGNYLPRFGPYFTEAHANPWGAAINLDGPESTEVRAFLVDNALMWLRDYHVDGLRLDAIHALHDDSALVLVEELADAVHELVVELDRPKVLIAETDRNDPRTVALRPGGWGIDAQWADDLHHALHVSLTGERDSYYQDFTGLDDVRAAVTRGFVYDGRYSKVRQRVHGRPLAEFDLGGRPADRLVTSLQNHDQIGNRAQGQRTNHLVTLDRYLVGATLALTSPGVPMLFQGEEWAASAPFLFFADHDDADPVETVAQGRIDEFAAFGWDPSSVPDPGDPDTFERSRLDWAEVDAADHRDVLRHYQALLELRRRHPALHDGQLVDPASVAVDDESIIVRRGPIVVAANLGARPVLVAIEAPVECLLATGHVQVDGPDITLAADSSMVGLVESLDPPPGSTT